MRRLLTIIMLGAVLAAAQIPAHCEGKTSVDPNSPEGRKLAAHEITKKLDPRLAQKVTYTCGQQRVYEVADDLSKITKVTIRGGKSKVDWRSRDIPVVVCVKDLPLGKLLRAITAATHANLFAEKIGDKDEPTARSYRLWRDKPRQDIIDNYFAEKDAADRARAIRYWDVGSRYKDVPDSEIDEYERNYKARPFGLAMSEVLSELGPEARDKVMAGDTIRLSLDNAPANMRDKLESMFKAEWGRRQIDSPERAQSNTGDPDWKKSLLMIYYDQSSLMVPIRDPYGRTTSLYVIDNVSPHMFDHAERFGLPKYVNPVSAPPVEDPDLAFIALEKKADFSSPGLNVKIDLRAPEGKDSLTFADLYAALAKASGYSVVCEDFESHRAKFNTRPFFTGDTTLGSVLKRLSDTSNADGQHDFFVDEADKIIVGRIREWPKRHRNLVPRELLDRMRAKLNTTGIDIDEYAELLSLDTLQFFDWISGNRDLDIAHDLSLLSFRNVWRFYNSLSPEDKAAVRSEAGLLLGKLDPARVVPVFEEHAKDIKNMKEQYMGSWEMEQQEAQVPTDPRMIEFGNVDKLPTDPEVLAGMTVRLKKEQVWLDPKTRQNVPRPTSTKGLIETRNYTLYYEWEHNGEKGHTRSETIFGDLPVYSKKRFAELYPNPTPAEQATSHDPAALQK